MCGRYTATGKVAEVDARFDAASAEVAGALGRYNVAPRQQVALVERTEDGERRARTARWGLLPRWATTSKDRMQPINARDDKLSGSRLWRPLLAKAAHRVLIPADGWYEWIHSEDRAQKPAPFRHLVDDGAWFAFAGLLNTTRVDDLDEPITTVTIITTNANGPAARLHDRMPAVLAGPDEEAAWLSPTLDVDDALALLRPLDDERVTLVAVSRRVNDVKNQGADVLIADPAS